MASKRVTLKWRKMNGEWRAGPFWIDETEIGFVSGRMKISLRYHTLIHNGFGGTVAEAKRACETLAARILGAMKGSQ